jgi:hypothetical protein
LLFILKDCQTTRKMYNTFIKVLTLITYFNVATNARRLRNPHAENEYYSLTVFEWWTRYFEGWEFYHCVYACMLPNVKRPENLRRPDNVIVNDAK